MLLGHFMAFTMDELRAIAKAHGIKRGRNKLAIARNLIKGLPENKSGEKVTFKVMIEIPIEKR